MNIPSFFVFLAVLMVGTGAYYVSDSKSPEGAADSRSTDSNRVDEISRKVFIDPETGKLTSKPNKQELEAFSQQQSVAGVGQSEPEIEFLPDGTGKAKLNGRFNQHLVATMDNAGNIQLKHVDNPDLGQNESEDSVKENK